MANVVEGRERTLQDDIEACYSLALDIEASLEGFGLEPVPPKSNGTGEVARLSLFSLAPSLKTTLAHSRDLAAKLRARIGDL